MRNDGALGLIRVWQTEWIERARRALGRRREVLVLPLQAIEDTGLVMVVEILLEKLVQQKLARVRERGEVGH
jgi:hypothetical protein